MITESARVQSESQLESFKQAGFEEYEFITTEGACDICLPMDGEIFKVKDGMPGRNMSPMHPFCKCSNAAQMSREAWDADLKARGLYMIYTEKEARRIRRLFTVLIGRVIQELKLDKLTYWLAKKIESKREVCK